MVSSVVFISNLGPVESVATVDATVDAPTLALTQELMSEHRKLRYRSPPLGQASIVFFDNE